jgi:hypothetical protein
VLEIVNLCNESGNFCNESGKGPVQIEKRSEVSRFPKIDLESFQRGQLRVVCATQDNRAGGGFQDIVRRIPLQESSAMTPTSSRVTGDKGAWDRSDDPGVACTMLEEERPGVSRFPSLNGT